MVSEALQDQTSRLYSINIRWPVWAELLILSLMLPNRPVHMAFHNIQDHRLISAATLLGLRLVSYAGKPASAVLMMTMIRHLSLTM